MAVLITNRQNRHEIPTEQIRSTAQSILDALGQSGAELSLLITGDAQIAELNQAYLSRTGPTNVIAFPMGGDEFPETGADLLGDVVISMDTAAREAAEAGRSAEQRFTELLIHGILHLLGYDHETNESDAAEMDAKTRELMAYLHSRES